MLKHYKGGHYTILATAKASTDIKEGEKVMIYISLQDGNFYARSIESAFESVKNGKVSGLSRFTLLSVREAEIETKKRMKKLGLTRAYAKRSPK